jgi:hypothetical protein
MLRKLLQEGYQPRGYIDPSFPPPGGEGSGDTPIIIYGYTPSVALAILAVVIFGVYSIAALYLTVTTRRKAVASVLLVGTVMEVVGYIARALSGKVNPYKLNYFVLQYFFIVVAPVMFSAAIYIAFGRLLMIVGPKRAPVRPRPVFLTFLLFDIITTGVQVAGAALIGVYSSRRRDPKVPNDILLAGLCVQVAAFAVFLGLFVYSLAKLYSKKMQYPEHTKQQLVAQRGAFYLLLASALLVMLRTCFRLAETAEGVGGYLATHEVFFGCLEFAPIVVAVAGLLALERVYLQRIADDE